MRKKTEVGTYLGKKKSERNDRRNARYEKKGPLKKKYTIQFFSQAITVLLVFINARLY